MGAAVQTIHGLNTNLTGSTTFDALTMATGDAAQVFVFPTTSRAWLLESWAGFKTAAGIVRIRSPRLHDNVQGIRIPYGFNPTLSGADGNPQVGFPFRAKQPLYPGDTLTLEANGAASDTMAAAFHIYYEDLEGVNAKLLSWAEVEPRIQNISAFQVSPTAGATQNYGTSVALNNLVSVLEAGFDYAVLGFQSQLPCTSIGIRGPNTGNLRIAMPLSWNQVQNGTWFADMSAKYGIPHIPTINALNAGATLVDAIDGVTNIATVAHVVLAQLQ